MNANAELIISIYELALTEHERRKSLIMEKVPSTLKKDLSALLMPELLALVYGRKVVYFEKDCAVPIKGKNGIEFPSVKLTESAKSNYENIRTYRGSGEATLVGMPTDFDLFALMNIGHPGYHQIKAALLIRQAFYEAIAELVDLNKSTCDSYYVRHSGKKLDAETMKKELAIFREAAILCVAGIMYSRYDVNTNVSHEHYKSMMTMGLELKVPPELRAPVKDQMGPSQEVFDSIEAKEFDLIKFESKLTGNLEWSVNKFVARAYEAVYHEI